MQSIQLGCLRAAAGAAMKRRRVALLAGAMALVAAVLLAPRPDNTRALDGRLLLDDAALRAPRLPYALQLVNALLEPVKEWLVPFDKEDLVARARWRTGLQRLWGEVPASGAGDASTYAYWNAGLDALLWDQRDPANPLQKTFLGRLFFREQLLGCLRAQLLATAYVEAHPEVLSRDLGALAVVTGHPRTSSTALHHALCAHPDATCLLLFEALNPVRPEGGLLSGLDLRELVAHVAVSSQAWMRPLFAL